MTDDDARWELWPYQDTGAQFLAARKFALLADAMGVGKSAQAVRATDIVFAQRILVVCPAIARINWAREFHKFSFIGPDVTICAKLSDKPGRQGVTICSYDYAAEAKRQLSTEKWDVLILDEAHFLKSMQAARTKAILGKKGLAHSAGRTWLLTGTPMTNHAGDLWPMLFVSGVTQKKYAEFIKHFCSGYDAGFGFKITGVKNVPELKALLGRIMLRRRKEDVVKDLPPISFSTFAVEPGPVDLEIAMYDLWRRAGGDEKLKRVIDAQEARVAEQIKALSKTKTPMRNLLPLMHGMQESLPELRQYTGMAKTAAIIEMVKRELDTPVEEGGIDKIVIFACHRVVIEAFRDALRKYKAVTLYGGTPAEKRQGHIDHFQNHPRYRVFVANIAAAGTAITLTAASEVIFAELDWTPANNAQAAMRVHRIGQTKPVRVRYAALADSTDEHLTETLRRKTRDELQIFGN